MRNNVRTDSPWEDIVGYSCVVTVSNIIEVAGTTAIDGYKLVGIGDIYEQKAFILKK